MLASRMLGSCLSRCLSHCVNESGEQTLSLADLTFRLVLSLHPCGFFCGVLGSALGSRPCLVPCLLTRPGAQ